MTLTFDTVSFHGNLYFQTWLNKRLALATTYVRTYKVKAVFVRSTLTHLRVKTAEDGANGTTPVVANQDALLTTQG